MSEDKSPFDVLTCISCKHLYFSAGEHDWSEYTPGCPPELRCEKGHWNLDHFNESQESYRKKLLTAQNCKDFCHYKTDPPKPDPYPVALGPDATIKVGLSTTKPEGFWKKRARKIRAKSAKKKGKK